MSLADLPIVVAVLLVTAWLGHRTARWAQVVLWLSALAVSAAMFLPMTELRALPPPDVLRWLESTVSAVSWTLPDVAHFIAFGWLAMVLWMLRPDLRGWRTVAILLALAVASELMQGLTIERQMRIGDVGFNLLGAGVGLVLAAVATWGRKRVRAHRESATRASSAMPDD